MFDEEVASYDAGRVLGSQIYVGPSIEEVEHDVPFAVRDVFINSSTGDLYQYNGMEWVFCYRFPRYIADDVHQVTSDAEALELDIGSVCIVAPYGGVSRMVRVVYNERAEKSLLTLGLGDGSLPFITEAVASLVNYYVKDEVYTKGEVDGLLAGIKTVEFKVVNELPPVGQSNIIYLVPHASPEIGEYYDEYCWIASQSRYEKLGNFDVLVNYYTKLEVEARLATKVDKVEGKGLSECDYTLTDKIKLAGIEAGAQVNTVLSVAGKTGNVVLNKNDVNLSHVDDTADLDKPVSRATQLSLNEKVEIDLSELQSECLILTQRSVNE